uniref:Ycf1 protein n=1 Tax=Boopis anthemoides TaxID=13361 RepID=UPI002E779A0C|nr:Ycf1 protein [Boopis anthemoides]WPM92969.1 Ycf1 protein [Boopis anthemoides]WVH38823.1 hypothetical chloroplast RF1 [Boopis anthemoides]
MILKSFLLGNLVSLCMKIINSVVVVGLYYGFLTTFSIGPSYLFLLRAHVMEEGEEGTEKKVSATTGFITGQLMMFISIYYAPLHLALGRPHTITVLALPYLLFHFFWNNHKHFFDYGSTTRNSMRNLSIQCVFLNNLIFQLFNYFILPSSMLARLVNIFMFRCNSKMLFLTSSFVGWIIGHILFMKWVGLVVVWIRQNRSIRSNKYIRSMSELKMAIARIFSIFFLIACVYSLGRIPSPIFTKKLSHTAEEREVKADERDVKKKITSKRKGKKRNPYKIFEPKELRVNGKEKAKDEFDFTETFHNNRRVYYMYGNQENWKLKILEKNKKDEVFWFEKPLVTLFFDSKRWNRPLRYIKKTNKKLQSSVRKEASQYFFYTCQSDGKQRISFTYPPSLSTFWEMLARRISLSTLEKLSADELYTEWLYTNKQKNNNFNNEFINRIEALETVFLSRNILETKTRLWNAETKNKNDFLVKMYDPFLNGMYRGRMKKFFSSSENSRKNCTEKSELNKIHGILLPYPNFREFEQKIERSEKKQGKIDSKNRVNFLFNAIITRKKKSIGINEIGKKPPRWAYKLISESQESSKYRDQLVVLEYHIRSRKAKRENFFTDKRRRGDPDTYTIRTSLSFLYYLEEPDFRRDLIKGSMRAQRRKTVIWELFQGKAHSPFFMERMKKPPFAISELMKVFFRNWVGKEPEFQIFDYTNEQTKRGEEKKKRGEKKKNLREKAQLRVVEAWENFPFSHFTRGSLLIAQSIFRRYIKFPSLIIAKNIGRILLLQFPEWSEDFQDLNREMYIKCTYNGIQFSETEFPKNWLSEGIQIKILYPFRLKPWHRSKLRLSDRDLMKKKEQNVKDDFDYCFLTVGGKEAKYPFGAPRETPSFFEPIFKDLNYKWNFRVLKKIKTFVVYVPQDAKNYVIQNFLFVKRIIKELLKENKIRLFIPREIYESKTEKDSIISNQRIHDSLSQIRSTDWINYSRAEEKMQNMIDRTSTIRNQIEKIEKEKKKVTPVIKRSPNKKNKNNNGESPQNIWKRLKGKNIQLIVKFKFFRAIFIAKIYIDILLCIINMSRILLQLFSESTKKIIDKYIYNNEINQERIKTKIDFISTRKEDLYNLQNSKRKSHIFFDLSYLSQIDVFLKLSQPQVTNLYKLRSILQYNGPSFFLKTEIKNFFGRQGVFHSELSQKKLPNFGINPSKNWLRGHYQSDFSQITWSRLVPQKWQNGINQCHTSQNKDLNKRYSYEKDQVLYYKKKKNSKVYSLPNNEDNLKKNYRYDLLSDKYINSETKKNSYIYSYSLEAHKNQENSTRSKEKFVNILKTIPIKNYLGKSYIIYMEKNPDRKYLYCKIRNFLLRKKVDIDASIKIDPNHNTNIKRRPIKYKIMEKIIDKIHNNGLFYLPIYSNSEIHHKKVFFDWTGINEKILNGPNLEIVLFPEFVILYQKYKEKPWFIPSKLLLFNWNINQNQEKKEPNLGSFIPNLIKKDYAEWLTSTENLRIFLKNRDFLFQLRSDAALNQQITNNMKIYCLLLKLRNPRKVTIASIQRKEMNLNIMLLKRYLHITELRKKGLLIIEPARLSVKNDGQFFMYQIIGISLVHKSKQQSNQRYREQKNVAKNNLDESIPRHKRKTLNRDKNHSNFRVPENILSSRRHRELRILIAFNLRNRNGAHRNPVFCKENKIKSWNQFLDESKHFYRNQNELIKFKFFFWPNFRLEDLACMNRYWFDTNNGSRLSMLRIYMYP